MSKTDYNLAEIEAVVFDVDGVLSPSTVPMDADGVPMRMVNIKDGYALQYAAKMGIKMAVITGGAQRSVIKRYQALGIADVFVGVSRKIETLRKWLADNNLDASKVAYCGDDIPDLECMATVGLPVAPADAAVEVRSAARYVTVACGGYGVARELLEQMLAAKHKWADNADAFGW